MYTDTANVEIGLYRLYVKWSLTRLVKNNGKTIKLTPQSSGSGGGL